MTALVVLGFHLLGIASSIHAVMNTRTEQGAIAWAVSLNTFPTWPCRPTVLGRSRFQGYVSARRENLEEIAGVTRAAVAAAAPFRVPEAAADPAGRALSASPESVPPGQHRWSSW